MHILVTGATGALGRYVVDEAKRRSHQITPASRRLGIDIRRPTGIDADVTIHCASDIMRTKAVEIASIAHLPGRIVYPGIVGADKIRFPYYKQKMAAEALLQDHAIVRLTQFHEFAERLAGLAMPMVPRHFQTQSIAAAEAAELLVDAAESDATGHIGDFGGPGVHDLAEQVRQVLARRGVHKRVWNPHLPGSRDFKDGHNLHAEPVGKVTWDEHLTRL